MRQEIYTNMWKKYFNTFVLSVLAGFMISFGGIVYLMCTNKIVGSLLFSFGLLTIVCQEFALYTGRIGYFKTYGFWSILTTIIGNFIGTYIIGTLIQLTRLPLMDTIKPIVETKLIDDPCSFFLLSIGCGAMMYLAVDNFKKSKAWFFVILPIMIFILSGFEHSIANMFYFSLANEWGMEAVIMTIIAIVGNGVGSWIVNKTNFLIQDNND